MSSDLGERLDRLAGGAPQQLSADDLWERGVRRGRRQRLVTGGAVAAAVVLVVALGGSLATMLRSLAIAPAVPGDQVSLPDRLEPPSPWARTPTLEDGPPGRLVAVVGGERSTLLSSEVGLYGVSATTGEYVWLDLPGLDAAAPVSLSPDGSRIGYWLERDTGRADATVDVVAGYAVLDTTTGELFRNEIGSDLGLTGEAIAWTPGRAWFSFFEVTETTDDSAAADGRPLHLVDLDDDTVTPLPLEDAPDLSDASSAEQGMLARAGRQLAWITAPDRADWTRLDGVPRLQGEAVPSTDGSMLSGIEKPGRVDCCRPGRVRVGVREGSQVRWHTVPGRSYAQVVGWRGPSEVLVRGTGSGVFAVDVASGASERVTTLPSGLRQQAVLAAALLDAPVVPAVDQSFAVDQRAALGWTTVVVLVAAGLLWRPLGRRRRAGA